MLWFLRLPAEVFRRPERLFQPPVQLSFGGMFVELKLSVGILTPPQPGGVGGWEGAACIITM